MHDSSTTTTPNRQIRTSPESLKKAISSSPSQFSASSPVVRPRGSHIRLLADDNTILERSPGEANIIGTAPDRSNELRSISIAEDAASARARDDTSTVGWNTASKVAEAGADLDAAAVGGDVGLDGSVSLVVSDDDADLASLAGIDLDGWLGGGGGSCGCEGSEESGGDESDLHFDVGGFCFGVRGELKSVEVMKKC